MRVFNQTYAYPASISDPVPIRVTLKNTPNGNVVCWYEGRDGDEVANIHPSPFGEGWCHTCEEGACPSDGQSDWGWCSPDCTEKSASRYRI